MVVDIATSRRCALHQDVAVIEGDIMGKLPCKKSNTVEDRYIPMSKCSDRHLYIIKARNADIGVYIAEEKAFKISRYKFTSNFIDKEFHWDIEPMELLPPPFPKLMGTAKPLKKLNYLGDMDDEKLLPYLNEKIKLLYFDIKQLKGPLTNPIVLIDENRMKQLRMFSGGI